MSKRKDFELKVKQYERFTIPLGSNPTTGYQLLLTQMTNHFAYLRTSYESQSSLCGSPGMGYFEFIALQKGTGIIGFDSMRVFDPQDLKRIGSSNGPTIIKKIIIE